MRGLLGDEQHQRLLELFSRAGLSMDHRQFDEDLLEKATTAILKTRDGKLRAAVPSPLGKCAFLNDVSMDELHAALRKHKQIMKGYPRSGEGLDAFVDSSDTGYTMNNKPAEGNGFNHCATDVNVLKTGTIANGVTLNGYGHTHSIDGEAVNGVPQAVSHAPGPEEVDGRQKGIIDGVTGYACGHTNGHTNGVH